MVKVRDAIADILFPKGIKCVVCDGELDRDTRYCICDKCKLAPNDTYCLTCGRAVPQGNTLCEQCKNESYGFGFARSCFVYEDSAATLVRRLKYYDCTYLAPIMAQFMADTYSIMDYAADIVTYVPMHRSRRRERGYNQAELLARGFAAIVGIGCEELLVKTVKTANMARLNREQRLRLIAGTFAAADGVDVKGKKILLIDDVLTTGATASECAGVLKSGGCGEVCVLTFCSGRPKNILI